MLNIATVIKTKKKVLIIGVLQIAIVLAEIGNSCTRSRLLTRYSVKDYVKHRYSHKDEKKSPDNRSFAGNYSASRQRFRDGDQTDSYPVPQHKDSQQSRAPDNRRCCR
mgnify:CR=1 FL=1